MSEEKLICDWCTKEAEARGDDGSLSCGQDDRMGFNKSHHSHVGYSPLWILDAEEKGEDVSAVRERLFPAPVKDLRRVDLFNDKGVYVTTALADYWKGTPRVVFVGIDTGLIYVLSEHKSGKRDAYVECTCEMLSAQNEAPKGSIEPLPIAK